MLQLPPCVSLFRLLKRLSQLRRGLSQLHRVFEKCSLQTGQLSPTSNCNGLFQSLFFLKSWLSSNHRLFWGLIHYTGFPCVFLSQLIFLNLLHNTGLVLAPVLSPLLPALYLLLWGVPSSSGFICYLHWTDSRALPNKYYLSLQAQQFVVPSPSHKLAPRLLWIFCHPVSKVESAIFLSLIICSQSLRSSESSWKKLIYSFYLFSSRHLLFQAPPSQVYYL